MALGDPRRDDADHPRVPAVGGEHVRRGLGPAGARRGDLRLGLEEDPRLDVAPLHVDAVELLGDRARPLDVGRQQQLEPRVGAVQPAGGVDPRREPEADRARVHPARVDARDLHQRLQPGLARRRERPQALAHQPPVLVHERHAVRHGGERDEVEVGVGGGGVQPGRLQQRAREQVRDAGRAQLRARVAADGRMDDRRVGQRPVRARRVVVGDDDVQPRSARGRHLVDGRDRAVDGDEQLRPARGEPLDGRAREPVAVVDPARQVPVDVRAERPQRPHEHRGRAHAVDVVVAVDGDPRAALDAREDPRRAVAQPAERVERMARPGGEERVRGVRVGEPAPDQHLRHHVRHAERRHQPLGGGVVVRGDLEADVGRRHARTVRRRADGPDPPLHCPARGEVSRRPVPSTRRAQRPGPAASREAEKPSTDRLDQPEVRLPVAASTVTDAAVSGRPAPLGGPDRLPRRHGRRRPARRRGRPGDDDAARGDVERDLARAGARVRRRAVDPRRRRGGRDLPRRLRDGEGAQPRQRLRLHADLRRARGAARGAAAAAALRHPRGARPARA